jgi:hypothetical protein
LFSCGIKIALGGLMAEASIFSIYFNWLFNGDLKSDIPPDLLKSSSPISNTYAISTFLNNNCLNSYLDKYFNNMGLWYLSKRDLFMFLKGCIKDFKISRNSMAYIPWKKTIKLHDELWKKFPELKRHDISFLCELIENSKDKENIMIALGFDEGTKKKNTKKEVKKKEKKEEEKDQTVEDFLKEHFVMEEE